MDRPVIRCIGCNKRPEELSEYVTGGKENAISATDYVITEEGTFNKFEKNKFYCDACYIRAGCPLNP